MTFAAGTENIPEVIPDIFTLTLKFFIDWSVIIKSVISEALKLSVLSPASSSEKSIVPTLRDVI